MLGHSHALSGAVTGLATGILLRMPLPHVVALAGFTAGMCWPDGSSTRRLSPHSGTPWPGSGAPGIRCAASGTG
jgi:hypothetical protein